MDSRVCQTVKPPVSSGTFARRHRRPFLLAAALFSALALPLSAADVPLAFNLERTEDRSEDYPVVFYTFPCGNRHYTFCPPAAWKISGGAAGMSLSAPGEGDAVARFRVSSPSELALLEPGWIGRREPALRKYLPAGACDVHQEGVENPNPLPVLGQKSVETVYRFNFYGRSLMASVVVCRLDAKNGFTLVTVAAEEVWKDFSAQVNHTLSAVGIVEEIPYDALL